MSSPSDHQHGFASFPSPWPLIDFNNNPLSCFLQEEPLHPPASLSSNGSSPPSQLLSSPSSMGPSTTKVSKRKSRAFNKPPIRVLSADRASFRDMVQKLTGIPSSSSLQGSRLWGPTINQSSIFRPMAATHPAGSHSDFTTAAHQSMPTLDTSSAYLTRAFSDNTLMYNNAVGNAGFNDNYEANYNGRGTAAGMDMRGLFEGGAYAEAGKAMGAADMEGTRMLRRTSELESLLMGGNKLDDLLAGRIDPWLSSDLIHTPSPHVEITHSA